MSYERLLSKDYQGSSESGDEHVNSSLAQPPSFLLRPQTRAVIQWTVLVLNLLILLLLILQFESRVSIPYHSTTLRSISTTFDQNRAFQSLDHVYDEAWAAISLNRTSAGMIKVSGSKTDNSDREIGSISMFHQLHCLTMFRKALQDASDGEKIGIDWHDDDHWPHCMDYLLQTILCFADDTIERPLRRLDGTLVIDGSNVVRQCKSAKPLYDLYAEKGI